MNQENEVRYKKLWLDRPCFLIGVCAINDIIDKVNDGMAGRKIPCSFAKRTVMVSEVADKETLSAGPTGWKQAWILKIKSSRILEEHF